jgi:hypothetical protein
MKAQDISYNNTLRAIGVKDISELVYWVNKPLVGFNYAEFEQPPI